MNFNYQTNYNNLPISGIYNIIINNSYSTINNNIVNSTKGYILGINNSNIYSKNLLKVTTSDIDCIAINNTKISFDELNKCNIYNNSFINFPYPQYLSYDYSTGGEYITIYDDLNKKENQYKINFNCGWSSILVNGSVGNFYWSRYLREFTQDSIYQSTFTTVGFTDTSILPKINTFKYNLPIGNGYTITFNITSNKSVNINNSHILSGITLSTFKDSSIILQNLTEYDITLENINISLNNIKNLNIKNIQFNNISNEYFLNLRNNKLILFENVQIKNCNINNYNNKITFKNSNINFSKYYINNFESSSMYFSQPPVGLYDQSGIYMQVINEFNNKNLLIEINKNFYNYEKLFFDESYIGTIINHSHNNLYFLKLFSNSTTTDSLLLPIDKYPTISDTDISKTIEIKEAYYAITINNTLIPVLNQLPIGATYILYQHRENNDNNSPWLPKVPYGFYELTSTTQVKKINIINPQSVYYNYYLAKMLCKNNTSDNNYFTLPSAKVIMDASGKNRFISIIKYNFNIFVRE